jgi:hypothetical protein
MRAPVDGKKRKALIDSLSRDPVPQVVSVKQFFDGNDDLGSIGCNLDDHPGVETFREALERVERRPDVEAVVLAISELDPGEGCWPFVDTVLVAGTISPDELHSELSELQPDEIRTAEEYQVPEIVTRRFKSSCLVAWWD